MAIEEMLADILTKLEEMNAMWLSPAEQQTPSSPLMSNILTADTEEPEACVSSISTKAATASSASLIPPTTLAQPQDVDPSFHVTELSYIHHTLPDPLVSIDDDFRVHFDADDGGNDRLSLLPDLLLRNIVSRLPIKDVARTAVLSRRWNPIWRAAPLLVDSVDLAVLHLNSIHFCGLMPRSLDRLHFMLHELDISNKLLVGTADQERVVCWSTISTNSKAAMTSPASPTPSSPSATPWGASPAVCLAFPKHVVATHVRCSTPGLYQIVTTLMPATMPLASTMSTSTVTPRAGATITKHILATSPTSINHRQGTKIPKPPWLLGTEVFRSWSCKMQLLSGFLLEVSPWCRDYMVCMQWQPSMISPVQTEVPSNDMLLHPTLWPLFSQNHARIQIATMICVWTLWCFCSEHVRVDYLLACSGAQFRIHMLNWLPELFVNLVATYGQFTMMALNMQREITMDWSSSAWYMSLYWDIWMEQMQNEDMILTCEKHWQNKKMVFCLKLWALYGHKQVTDQKVQLRPWRWPWLSFGCHPTKACANALNYLEVSADSMYQKCECWLNIHSKCVLAHVAGCWHFLSILLSVKKWCAQPLDLVAMRKLFFSLHVQKEKALYVQTWRLTSVLGWCQIHTMNLNHVCFSEIQQVFDIHWKEIRSELRGSGMIVDGMTPSVQLKKAFRGGMYYVFLMHDHPFLLELVDTKEDVRVVLLLMPVWTSPTIPEPWPPCVTDIFSGSEQATPIRCQSNMFWSQKFLVWLHQKLIVVLCITIIKYWQVILWDPGGAQPLTIRLMVFLLQPCNSCWWYKNANRCCITDSSNYWSSWVRVPRQNIGSKTTSFLNASIEQIFLQDNAAGVQRLRSGQYPCYLNQLNDDWCHGRFILSIMSVRVIWDPGGLKFVRGFAATA